MRKSLLTACCLFTLCLPLFSQYITDEMVQIRVDSLKKLLNRVKGKDRVDCLNNLAYGLWWLLDQDTSLLHESFGYATQSFDEAISLGYKKGLGYAYEQLENCEAARADTNRNPGSHFAQAENYARQAIQIGEELDDHLIIGSAYRTLVWLEKSKGNKKNSEIYLQLAIAAYEKTTKQEASDAFRELDFVDAPGCLGNEAILGRLHEDLCAVYVDENNITAAKQQMVAAISYFEKINDRKKLGNLYNAISNFYFLKHDYEMSEKNLKISFSYYQSAKDSQDQIRVYTQLCKMYEITGDFESGLEYSKRDISLAEELKKIKPAEQATKFWGQAFFWMSRLYTIAGDYETAMDIIHQGQEYYPKNDSFSVMLWSSQIGNVHRLMGNYDSAIHYLGRFATSKPDQNNLGLVALGYLYIDLKEYDKALQLVNPDIEYLKKVKSIMPPLASSLMIAASAYEGKKNYKKALRYAQEAQADLVVMKGKVLMIDDYKLLSDIFNNLERNDSAYLYLKQYTILKDSLLNRQFYWRLNNYKKEAEQAKKEAQIGFLNRDNKIKEEHLSKEASLRNFLIVGFLLFLCAGLFVIRSLSLKRKNEKLLSEKKQTELHQRVSELEMQALRAQMNPHFIFNCLNSINLFIFKNETKAASDYLTRFSRLIRMVLLHSQKKFIALEDELEILQLYLDMERLRFKNAFNYSITTTNAVETNPIFIPPLLLQPFCENAIWHGLMHKDGQGHLNIEIGQENSILSCTITDDGVGREKAEEFKSKSAEKEKSMGLKITKERLSLLNQGTTGGTFYQVEDVLDDFGKVAGTKVKLQIRYKELVDEPA